MSTGDKLRLGVIGSGKGSNLETIFRAIHDRPIAAEVAVVLSDVRDAGIISVARAHRVHAKFVYPGESESQLDPQTERNFVNALQAERVELVVLAGFMRIVGPQLLAAFPQRVINIHPSLLPKYRGLRAWEQALLAGETVTGCTVHYVDEGVDTGAIIAQAEVDILPGDTAEVLHARIQEGEHMLYPEVIDFFARERPFAG
ncbi:MAG: phosphoribosylglycinamide formyltransferase [Verrucomicrobiota bacterium]|jgi:phosphoribosylglycinamide formyltransferase-1